MSLIELEHRRPPGTSDQRGLKWTTGLILAAFLAVIVVLANTGSAAAAPTNPFTQSGSDTALIEACNDSIETNHLSWNPTAEFFNPYDNVVESLGGTYANGCMSDPGDNFLQGMWSYGNNGTVTDTGPQGYWLFAPPTGTSITGLHYNNPDFNAGGHIIAGWFGQEQGQALAADEDPTQTATTFDDDDPPHDCVMDSPATYSGSFDQGTAGTCNAQNTSGDYQTFNLPLSDKYQEIALGMECRGSGAECDYGNYFAHADNILFQVYDPDSDGASPANGATVSTTGALADGTSQWLSGAGLMESSGASAMFTPARDDMGYCVETVGLYNGAGAAVDTTNAATAPAVDASTRYYESPDPCHASSSTDPTATFTPASLTTNLASVPSGTYYLNAVVANAPEYQNGTYDWYAGGESSSSTTAPQTAGDTVQLDNTTPSLQVVPSADGTSGTLNVTVGPSGLASASCTQAGSPIQLTAAAGNPSAGAGTYIYNLPGDTSGLVCSATNGDANAALTGSTTTPTISFADPGYTRGTWANSAQTVTVGLSGANGSTLPQSGGCTVDGSSGNCTELLHLG